MIDRKDHWLYWRFFSKDLLNVRLNFHEDQEKLIDWFDRLISIEMNEDQHEDRTVNFLILPMK